jgi:hypothetical protein
VAANGEFYDLMRHTPEQDQTATISSSIDPWHASSDLGPTTREQIGLDFFYTSGYTRGLPAMIPIALIYSTPEDAAAQITYLKKRGYPISYIEMGEEPDGQYMLPEDYAALYLQFATRSIASIRSEAWRSGISGRNEDIQVWPMPTETSVGRFLDHLRAHGRLNDLPSCRSSTTRTSLANSMEQLVRRALADFHIAGRRDDGLRRMFRC